MTGLRAMLYICCNKSRSTHFIYCLFYQRDRKSKQPFHPTMGFAIAVLCECKGVNSGGAILEPDLIPLQEGRDKSAAE